MGPQVGLAQQDPWLGRAGLWELEAGLAAETDSPRELEWCPWLWVGAEEIREGSAGTVRLGDIHRTLSEGPAR